MAEHGERDERGERDEWDERGERGHREISHTADLAFEVWAPDLPSLFAEATGALAGLCYDRDRVEPRERRRIASGAGGSREEALVHWLQEVYFVLESEMWLAREAVDLELDGDGVRGTLRGEPFDAERHTLHTEIKAITYHDMRIEEHDGRWSTRVVVDV